MYFVSTSNAIPADSLSRSGDPLDFDTYSQFCPQEIETLDLEDVGVYVDHAVEDDMERKIEPFGAVTKTMKPDSGALFVMTELHPVPNRDTPEGQRRNMFRRALIKMIKSGSAGSVSVSHNNDYELQDGKIKCQKNITDVSFTTKPGRPGSNVVEYAFSPTSMRKHKEYRTATSGFSVNVDRRQIEFIPKQVKANIKNFEEAKRLFYNDTSKLTTSEMSTAATAPVPASATAPVPTAPVPSAASATAPATATAPVLPGSEAASAYLKTIAEMDKKLMDADAESARLRGEVEKYKKSHGGMERIKEKRVADVREALLDNYNMAVGDATSVLGKLKDVDPEAATQISKIEAEKAADIESIKTGTIAFNDDDTTISVNSEALANALKGMKHQVYAYNLQNRVNVIAENRRVFDAQAADIAKVLGKRDTTTAPNAAIAVAAAASSAPAPAVAHTPAATPAASTGETATMSVSAMGGNLKLLTDGLAAMPGPKRTRFDLFSK